MSLPSVSRPVLALGLLAAVGFGALALRLAVPPPAVPASAAAAEFSAERAQRHVEALAAAPRPPGTEAHAAAEAYLLHELEVLGFDTEVQEGWSAESVGPWVVGAKVRNIVARRKGNRHGPALVLLTHYDSVPTGPGAADDAAGVAAVLEAVRALREGRPLANDLIVLITDGEEVALLGARLFVDEHSWADDVGLVLTFESRGNRGTVQMFQTSPGGGRLVRAMAAVSPTPFASSIAEEVYRRMPNDNDLSVFLEAGSAGLNFAMIGGHPAYHTELDTPENLSPETLQHLGSHVLALSLHFGDADLTDLAGSSAVYFNPLGSRLVVYSTLMGRILAVATACLWLVAVSCGRRRSRLSWSGLRGGLWCWLGVMLSGALLSFVAWELFARIFPDALATPWGEPYAAGSVKLAILLVVAGGAGFVASLFDSASETGLLAGALLPWVGGAWLLSLLVPGAGYLLVWPAVGATVGLLAAFCLRSPVASGLGVVIGGVVAVMLYAPIASLVADALGFSVPVALGLFIALPLTLCAPALASLLRGNTSLPLALAAAGAGLLVWVGSHAQPTASTPAPTSLFYLLDAQKAEALWLSYEEGPDEWTAQVIPEDAPPGLQLAFLPKSPDAGLRQAPADAIELPGPTATLVEDVVLDDGTREIRLRLRSRRSAPAMLIGFDTSMATLLTLGVEGEEFDVDESVGSPTMMLHGVPPDGVEISIRTFDRQPLSLDVVDWSWGLGEVARDLSPRPDYLIRRPRWLTDSVLVRSNVWF